MWIVFNVFLSFSMQTKSQSFLKVILLLYSCHAVDVRKVSTTSGLVVAVMTPVLLFIKSILNICIICRQHLKLLLQLIGLWVTYPEAVLGTRGYKSLVPLLRFECCVSVVSVAWGAWLKHGQSWRQGQHALCTQVAAPGNVGRRVLLNGFIVMLYTVVYTDWFIIMYTIHLVLSFCSMHNNNI